MSSDFQVIAIGKFFIRKISIQKAVDLRIQRIDMSFATEIHVNLYRGENQQHYPHHQDPSASFISKKIDTKTETNVIVNPTCVFITFLSLSMYLYNTEHASRLGRSGLGPSNSPLVPPEDFYPTKRKTPFSHSSALNPIKLISTIFFGMSQQQSSSSLYQGQQNTEWPPPAKPPKKSGSRSAIACNLCRAQKMKCEGPSCQPCKRCQRLKQPCVFGESQGRGRQVVWAKRTEELEARVSKLEEELSETKARVCRVEAGINSLQGIANLQATPKQQSRKRKHSSDTPLPDDPQPSPSARASMVEGPETSKAIQAAQYGPRRTDLIDRGMLSPEMARRLFEIHQTRWAPQIPWLNIPDTFDNVRWHSPLMLAVACSAGAKGCKDVDTYRKMKAHALELILDVVFYRVFPHDRPQSYQDLIAVIGCIIHCGLYIDPVLVVDHAEHLRLRDVFDRIPEPRWQSEFDQRQLLSVARTFIGVYIHSVLYSTLTGKPCVMRIARSVLILYCEIICNSPYSVTEWDSNLIHFVKYYAIMQEAQEALDSHYRLGSIDIANRLAVVEKYSALVDHWKQELDRTKPDLLPAAASEFKHLYHRAFAYLSCFVTQVLKSSLRTNKQGLRLAKEGVAHALEVLKQFINSRRAEPGLPCVHLEYRKTTIAVATACILEGCLLIPEHIDVDHCRNTIKTFADELDKEGGEWGVGTEDKYVKTLRTVLQDLDSRAIHQSANIEDEQLLQEETPSLETNEIQSSLPSPLDLNSSAGLLGPSPLQDSELMNGAGTYNLTPQEACQNKQLYGHPLLENTQIWTHIVDMPIRSEKPPTSLINYDQSIQSYNHDPLEGLKMAYCVNQKPYDSFECESSMPMIEKSPKVVFSDEAHAPVRTNEEVAGWKVEPSPICFGSIGYPAEMAPENDEHLRHIFAHSASVDTDPPSNHHHFHQLIQAATESGSSFSHSHLSPTFAGHPCHSDHTESFLIHPHAQTQQAPIKTFDLIQSLRTVYPDRMDQATFQKTS
ncbi:hypothetical protein PCANC_11996 [Puccinia coronata f. sp. avenae]|uniref:Zn(2)-C6 fungal-type domain-containing protein n=1 Tax=Puccinia coronata f. sp. avenae TaxID=200324 RepID=A0A2N5SX64_9BASI|nr:hypothetical protein PCANC_11996 [Puccinia coronata f. sp. avenae]